MIPDPVENVIPGFGAVDHQSKLPYFPSGRIPHAKTKVGVRCIAPAAQHGTPDRNGHLFPRTAADYGRRAERAAP